MADVVAIGRLAIEADQARRTRAKARTTLTRLRRQWMQDYDSFYDREEHCSEEGTPAMEAALTAKKEAQATYRRIASKLSRAITKEQE